MKKKKKDERKKKNRDVVDSFGGSSLTTRGKNDYTVPAFHACAGTAGSAELRSAQIHR